MSCQSDKIQLCDKKKGMRTCHLVTVRTNHDSLSTLEAVLSRFLSPVLLSFINNMSGGRESS